MNDMMSGQPAYIPNGDVARSIARELISRVVRERMARGNLTVSLGEMADDGTIPLYVTAEPETFDFATMLDNPTISGVAWIEDRDSQPIHVWYSFRAQEHTPAESNYADNPPVAFWAKYGR